LPGDAFVRELCRRYDGIPRPVLESPELLELLLPALRADMTLTETYEYVADEPLDVPISVFGGTEDVRIGRGDLEAWQVETRDRFSLQMVPGGHFFLNNGPSRALILKAIDEDLRPLRTTAE
jgi:medium-chain acyl-[acyl-carrier-protein] hydrolase